MKPKTPKPKCRNCGDPTTFSVAGDRQPDYQRVSLGWCQRCLNACKVRHRDPAAWEREYQRLLASQGEVAD